MAFQPHYGAQAGVGSGLLNAAASYPFPMTRGLLAAAPSLLGASAAPNYTQEALALAGNPHAGPYANAPGFPAAPGGVPAGGSTATGASTGDRLAGSVLGLLNNPAVSGYLKGLLPDPQAAQDAAAINTGMPAIESGISSGLSGVDNVAPLDLSGQVASDFAPAADAAAASAAGAAATGPALQDLSASIAANESADAANAMADADSALGSSGASSGASSALGDAGTALGALGAGYSLYNTIKNYQSGATGSDALNGAETGASIGTMIVPGIGTLIGGLIGGAAGAIGSAFGGGKQDPESQTVDAIDKQGAGLLGGATPAQAFDYLAGVMDAKNNSPGHSAPIEQVFGRMGEGNLLNQMAAQINSADQAGKISATTPASQVYSSVIAPWLQSKGAAIDPNAVDVRGNNFGQSLQQALQDLTSGYLNGSLTAATPIGSSGQVDASLPAFVGLLSKASPAPGWSGLHYSLGSY